MSICCDFIDLNVSKDSSAKALYNSTSSTDFELHPSEQTELVIKILQLSGITIKDFNLVQAAGQEENRGIQQEKL